MSEFGASKSYMRSLLTTTIAFSLSFSTLVMANVLSLNAQNSQSVRVSSDVDKKAQTQIYLSQAQSLFDQGLYDRSMSMVNKAIDLSPNNALAWQLLGNCLKKMGRDREALTAYDQAVKLLSVPDVAIAPPLPINPSQGWTQPNSQSTNDIAQLWIERARTLDRLNRFQESVAAYDQALKIRCQEQLLRTNEAFPPVCQSYVLSAPNNASSNNLPVPNSNRDAVIAVPVSPPYSQPQQSPVPPSKPSRVVW